MYVSVWSVYMVCMYVVCMVYMICVGCVCGVWGLCEFICVGRRALVGS